MTSISVFMCLLSKQSEQSCYSYDRLIKPVNELMGKILLC